MHLKDVFRKTHIWSHYFDGTFNEVPIEKRIYIILTTLFYFYQLYQNVLSCIGFYKKYEKYSLLLL